MHNKEIIRITEEIRSAAGTDTNKRAIYSAKYPDFATNYPKLLDAALNKKFPLTYLSFMLEEKDKLEANKLSVDEADKLVYDKLRADYIDPLIQPKE